MKKRWGGTAALGVAVTALLGLSLTATSSAGASSGTTRGVTSTSITVGGLGFAEYYGDSAIGAEARFNAQNKAGGVNGRKIKFVGFKDDQSSPTVDIQQGKALVEQDQVFAVVPVVSITLAAGAYFAQQHVPFFGWGISPQFIGNKYGFSFAGAVTSPSWEITVHGAEIAKVLGKSPKDLTMGIIGEDSTASKEATAPLVYAMKSIGYKIVYAQNPLPSAPAVVSSYTPYVQQIMTANGGQPPDVLMEVISPGNLGLQPAMEAAGYKGALVNYIQYSPATVAGAKGAYVYLQFAPYQAASTNPAVATMIQRIKAVAPNAPLTQGIEAGYFAADQFIAALKKTGKNVTAESFQKAADSMTYQIKNTVGPTTFPRGQTVPTSCGSTVTSNGTQWQVSYAYLCTNAVHYPGG
jgi:branched-chain amino acid transport system substrate-binding protein